MNESRELNETSYNSQVENAIMNATDPLPIDDAIFQEVTVDGEKGLWLNKLEVDNWVTSNLIDYPINQDDDPIIIRKKPSKKVEQVQTIKINYLRPPTPPAPGEIIILKEPNKPSSPGPPLIIRQVSEKAPDTQKPLIFREAPPVEKLQPIKPQIITIPGKVLPPPPRKVIINREYYYINAECKRNGAKSVSGKNESRSKKEPHKTRYSCELKVRHSSKNRTKSDLVKQPIKSTEVSQPINVSYPTMSSGVYYNSNPTLYTNYTQPTVTANPQTYSIYYNNY